MKRIITICVIITLLFTILGNNMSFSYATNDVLSPIHMQETPEGIFYAIGDEWELLETEQGTIVKKMPQDIERNLRVKYFSNADNRIDDTNYGPDGSFKDIIITMIQEQIAKLVWNGVEYVVVSLVTGNPVPAAIVVLSISIVAIATMTVAAIYLVGTYERPIADKVVSTSGCISRDGGRTWTCPYRFVF